MVKENWIKTNALSETAYAISIRLFYSYYDDINQYLIDLNITIKELIAFVNTLTYVDSDDKKLFNNLLKIFLSSNYETEFFNFYNEYVIGDKKYDTLKLCSRIIGIQTEHLQILIPDTGNQIDNYEQTKIMKYLEIITFNEQTSNYQINKNLFFSDDFIKDGITWTSLKFILECYANSLWNPNKYQVTYYYSDADYYDSGSPTSLLKTFMETLIPQVSNIFSVMKYSLSNNINNVLLNVGNTEFKLLSYKYETKRVGSKNITSLIIFNYFRTITTKELMDEGEKIAENNNKEVREIAESACETITNFEGKNSVKSILNNEYFSDNVLAGITIDSAANLSFLSGLKTLGDFGKQVSLMVLIKQQLADSVFAFFTGDTAFSQVSASLLGKYKNFKILNPKINYSMSGIFVGFKPMVEPMEEPAEEEMLLLNKYRDQYAEKYPEYYWEDDFSNGGVFDFGKKNNILSKINKDINYLKVLKVK